MRIFNEIFEILSQPEFERQFPEHYFREIKRIRDLKNSFDTAYEEGRAEKNLEIAKNLLKQGVDVAVIISATGLTKEQVAALKKES